MESLNKVFADMRMSDHTYPTCSKSFELPEKGVVRLGCVVQRIWDSWFEYEGFGMRRMKRENLYQICIKNHGFLTIINLSIDTSHCMNVEMFSEDAAELGDVERKLYYIIERYITEKKV